jgi:hypothetical protein
MMIRRYLLNVGIILILMIVVIGLQFTSTRGGLSLIEGISNIRDRLGLFLAVWVGGAFVGGAILMVFQHLGKKTK